jgi:hypothetical protein
MIAVGLDVFVEESLAFAAAPVSSRDPLALGRGNAGEGLHR